MDLTADATAPAGTLVTERLLLRPLAVDDATALARLLEGDWEAIKQTGRMPYPATESALRRWIASHIAPASHSTGAGKGTAKSELGDSPGFSPRQRRQRRSARTGRRSAMLL